MTQYFEQFVETFHIVPVEPRNKMPYECLGDIAYIGIIAVVKSCRQKTRQDYARCSATLFPVALLF